ncbi:MAG: MFS transporter [candidate division WOR-3 bacterium]
MPTAHLIQFLYSLAVVGPVIIVPLLASSLGASPATVGLVVATYQATLFGSSALFGRLADLRGHRRLILIGLLAAAGVQAIHVVARDLMTLLVVRALAGIAFGIFPAAVLAYATRENHNLGRFASLGALGWAVGSSLAGVLAVFNRVFLVSAGIYLASFLIALFFLRETHERLRQPFFDAALIRRNWRVYLSFFLRHAGAMGIWTIFPLYLSQLGANRFWIGVIYGLNSFGQFILMPLLSRWRSTRLIQMGLYASIITFLGFALCHNYRQIIPLQVLLAFAWSALYVGSLQYLIETNPERASVAGIFNSTLSLAGIVGALVGGAVASFGLPAVMLNAAVMAVLGALVFRFREPDGKNTSQALTTDKQRVQ